MNKTTISCTNVVHRVLLLCVSFAALASAGVENDTVECSLQKSSALRRGDLFGSLIKSAVVVIGCMATAYLHTWFHSTLPSAEVQSSTPTMGSDQECEPEPANSSGKIRSAEAKGTPSKASTQEDKVTSVAVSVELQAVNGSAVSNQLGLSAVSTVSWGIKLHKKILSTWLARKFPSAANSRIMPCRAAEVWKGIHLPPPAWVHRLCMSALRLVIGANGTSLFVGAIFYFVTHNSPFLQGDTEHKAEYASKGCTDSCFLFSNGVSNVSWVIAGPLVLFAIFWTHAAQLRRYRSIWLFLANHFEFDRSGSPLSIRLLSTTVHHHGAEIIGALMAGVCGPLPPESSQTVAVFVRSRVDQSLVSPTTSRVPTVQGKSKEWLQHNIRAVGGSGLCHVLELSKVDEERARAGVGNSSGALYDVVLQETPVLSMASVRSSLEMVGKGGAVVMCSIFGSRAVEAEFQDDSQVIVHGEWHLGVMPPTRVSIFKKAAFGHEQAQASAQARSKAEFMSNIRQLAEESGGALFTSTSKGNVDDKSEAVPLSNQGTDMQATAQNSSLHSSLAVVSERERGPNSRPCLRNDTPAMQVAKVYVGAVVIICCVGMWLTWRFWEQMDFPKAVDANSLLRFNCGFVSGKLTGLVWLSAEVVMQLLHEDSESGGKFGSYLAASRRILVLFGWIYAVPSFFTVIIWLPQAALGAWLTDRGVPAWLINILLVTLLGALIRLILDNIISRLRKKYAPGIGGGGLSSASMSAN